MKISYHYVYYWYLLLYNFRTFKWLLHKEKGLLAGLSSALVIIVIILIINLFVKEPITLRMVLKFLTYTAGSAAGGIMGVNIPRSK